MQEAINNPQAEPSDETTALYAQIRRRRVSGIEGIYPSPWAQVRDNLPGPPTSIIGRGREMEELKRKLQTTRLLTLTGAGGCGKTRLALEVGPDLLAMFADGVWWVELAPLTDPTALPQAVATALSVQEQPGWLLVDTLTDYLRTKHLLLILDNCEHLVEACALLVESLLKAGPHLKILATSRETLGLLASEAVFDVPPLSTPDRGFTPPADVDLIPR